MGKEGVGATAAGRPGADCENCGAPEEALVAVHRIYLETDDKGRVTGSRTLPDREHWCLSCRTLYPNEAADG